MELYNVFALIVGMVVLGYFLLSAFKNIEYNRNIKVFLFTTDKINKNTFTATTVASGTSLATVVLFFLSTAKLYGFWLFISPITYIFGLYVLSQAFTKIVQKINVNEIGTISEFIFKKTNSNLLTFIIDGVTLLGFMSIILIEIVIGLQILNYFFELNNSYKLFGIITIVSVIAMYVFWGGYKTVIDSDVWQNKLILFSMAIFIVYLLVLFFVNLDKVNATNNLFYGELTSKELIIFLLNVIVLNLFLPISQLSSWHRFSISSTKEDVIKGITKGSKITFLLWSVLIISGLLIVALKIDANNVNNVFTFIINSGEAGAYVVFPLLFVGMLSALLSTADTSLITILYLKYSSNFIPIRYKNKITIFLSIFFTMLFIIGIYLSIDYMVGIDFLAIIFTVLGQLVLIGPILLFAVFYDVKLNNIASVFLGIGLLLSLFILWGISFYGMYLNKLWLSQLAIPISVIFNLFIAYISWKFINKLGVVKYG